MNDDQLAFSGRRLVEFSIASNCLSAELMAFDLCRQYLFGEPGEFYLTSAVLHLVDANSAAQMAWDEALDHAPLHLLIQLNAKSKRRLITATSTAFRTQLESIEKLLQSNIVELRSIDYGIDERGFRNRGVFARTSIPARTILRDLTGILISIPTVVYEMLNALNRTQYVLEMDAPAVNWSEPKWDDPERMTVAGSRIIVPRLPPENTDAEKYMYITGGGMQFLNHRCTNHINVNAFVHELQPHDQSSRKVKLIPKHDWRFCEVAWHTKHNENQGIGVNEELVTNYGNECNLECPDCQSGVSCNQIDRW